MRIIIYNFYTLSKEGNLMKAARKVIHLFVIMFSLGSLLAMAACGAQTAAPPAPDGQTADSTEAKAPATRKYTDYKGNEVQIPVQPQRVIFAGETFGDLLVLGVDAVGAQLSSIKDHVFENRVKPVADVGFPINLEKVLELKPDLILVASTDAKQYEQLSKVAPTVMFDTFAPLDERIALLGDLLGKQQQAKQWLADFNAKAEAMWKQLRADGMKDGETASVFTYYPGDRLFVMARAGLPQMLYHPKGFKPTPMIEEVLNGSQGFMHISPELLPQYAGDRIFILIPAAGLEDARKSTDELMKSRIWLDLPAVKKGHVYSIDISKSDSDASTREWMLEELPRMLRK